MCVVATRRFECAHKDHWIHDSLLRNVDLDGEQMELGEKQEGKLACGADVGRGEQDI